MGAEARKENEQLFEHPLGTGPITCRLSFSLANAVRSPFLQMNRLSLFKGGLPEVSELVTGTTRPQKSGKEPGFACSVRLQSLSAIFALLPSRRQKTRQVLE